MIDTGTTATNVECPKCSKPNLPSLMIKWNEGGMYECLLCGGCYQEEKLDYWSGVLKNG